MNNIAQKFICIFLFLAGLLINAQNTVPYGEVIDSRARVIIDNDFGGDPDGLFQLAHHVLSPSVEIKAIIGSKHYANGFYGSPGTCQHACELAGELLNVIATGK